MTLWQSLALSMRQRPLLLPMLVATLALDLCLTVAAVVTRLHHYAFMLGYWGVALPQLGLLTLWAARSGVALAWRVAAVAGLLAWMVGLFGATQSPPVGGIIAILLAYCGVLSAVAVISRVVQFYHGRGATQGAPQFSLWQLMVVTTATAAVAALGRVLEWPLLWREVPILVLFILIPLLATWAFAKRWPAALRWAPAMGVAVVAEWFYLRGPSILGLFFANALVCSAWLAALQAAPDATRRRADRLTRRAVQPQQVESSPAEPISASPDEPHTLPFDASG